jgi:hypothetical protein
MNTSQKQLISNTVLESYFTDSKQKSISKIIDVSIWITLCILILSFAFMLSDAYSHELIDTNYNFVLATKFAIVLGLIVIAMPQRKANSKSIKTTATELLENRAKAFVNNQVSNPLNSIPNEQKSKTSLETVKTKTNASQVNFDYNFNNLHFGHNMQYNGLYAAKPATSFNKTVN